MDLDELCMQGLREVARLIERRELSPVDLTAAVLARIERLDPTLHSYLTVTPERAVAAARAAEQELVRGERRGPLHGVPIAVKDLCATRGVRTTCASGVFAQRVPDRDATVVQRLTTAGAVLLGKQNLTEFALMGYHPSLPRPRNPWNVRCDTGGSSSGPGAATAAGLCFGTVGTDTGGSIRFPAAWCGVVGLKPTYGRVSRAGVFPLAASLDHVGPMARRVADAALLLDAMAGFDPADPTSLREPPPQCAASIDAGVRGLRIGWDARFVRDGTQTSLADAVERAVRDLAAEGAEVVEVEVPPVDAVLPAWPVLCAAEAAVAHAATYPARAAEYGPTFRTFLEYAATLRAEEYARHHQARCAWSGELRGVFEQVDALACPSMFMTPLPLDAIDPYGTFVPDFAPFMRFSAPFNFSGSPTLSLPCGFTDDGLPYSLQLVGRHGGEAVLCRLGHVYEQSTAWHRRRPPIA